MCGVDPVQKVADKIAELVTAASNRLKRGFGEFESSHPPKSVPHPNSEGTTEAYCSLRLNPVAI